MRCLESKDIDTNCNSTLNSKLIVGNSTYIKQILVDIWTKFRQALLADPNELKVWEKVDRQGNKYWCVYDPKTDKSFYSGSEAEIYIWIEQVSRSSNYVRTCFSNW
jgi:hypothetical protein